MIFDRLFKRNKKNPEPVTGDMPTEAAQNTNEENAAPDAAGQPEMAAAADTSETGPVDEAVQAAAEPHAEAADGGLPFDPIAAEAEDGLPPEPVAAEPVPIEAFPADSGDSQLDDPMMVDFMADDENDEYKLSETTEEIPEFDLDAQIEKMLRADAESAAEFTTLDKKEIVKERAYFDDGQLHTETELKENTERAYLINRYGRQEKRSRFQEHAANSTYLKLVLEGLYLAFIIIGLGGTVAFAARTIVSARESEELIAHYTLINLSDESTNNANFIFINEMFTLSGENVALQKISADRLGSTFHFEGSFDPDDYIILLYDQNYVLYHRHKADTPYKPGENTILRFDSFYAGTQFLTLFIQHIETRETVNLYYQFERAPLVSHPVYLYEPVELLDFEPAIKIERAIFGSSGTEITYSMFGTSRSRGILDGSNEAPFTLRELMSPIATFSHTPAEYFFGANNLILGKMFFAPVNNRSGSIGLELANVSYSLQIPDTFIDVRHLFTRGPGSGQTIYVGENKLVLEGMDTQGRFVVLVLHSEDPSGERIQTDIDAVLVINTDDGPIVLQGDCRSIKEGSDVLFEMSEEIRAAVVGVPASQYDLIINSVSYLLPQMTVLLDLEEGRTEADIRVSSVEMAIWEAFMSRLDYKSGIGSIYDISGFSPRILNDRVMMRNYSPRGTSEVPMYAAKVTNGLFIDRYVYIAIVEEEWAVIDEWDNVEYYSNTHRIRAEFGGDGWDIIEDIIL